MNYRFFAMVLLAAIAGHAGAAQPEPKGVITLSDAVRATLEANPQLRAFPLRANALEGQRQTAGLKPPLTINSVTEEAFGTGAVSGLEGAELTLSLSSVIELGGKRDARVAVVSRRLEQLDIQRRITELDLVADVAFRFIEVVAAQERLQLQDQATALAGRTLEALRPLVEAGRAPQLELDRADASLIRANTAQRAAARLLESARVSLSSLWASQAPAFASANAAFYELAEPTPLTSLLAAVNENPDIVLFAGEERLRDAELREAMARRQSDVQWTAGVRHLRDIDDTGLVFNVNVPLFSQRRAGGAIETARAQLAEVETRREAALNDLRGRVAALYQQLEQAVYEVNTLQREVLPLLTQVQTQTLEAYQGGLYSYTELAAAQRDYLDARLALITAAANAHRYRTEIERLTGEALSGQ